MKGKTLSLCVSGKLWNRSLIMMDVETGSLWSHILGEAMQGELKGTKLESLPCDMVTWDAWLREHPKTTVLNLSRHKKLDYTNEFYRKPERFVLGFTGNYGIQHCSLTTLIKHPLLNADARGLPLLITFDSDSTSARIFSRKLGDQQLTFASHKKGLIRDDETGSVWNRATGIAVERPLKGKRLKPQVGIMSYTRAWSTFHPDSKEVIHPELQADSPDPASEAIESAIRKAIPLLEKGSAGSAEQRRCFTCHNQGVPVFALVEARRCGFTIDEENLKRQLKHTAAHLNRRKAKFLEGGGKVIIDAYATGTVLVALMRAADVPADHPAVRRGVQYLVDTQLKDGSWHVVSRAKPFQTYFESAFPHGKDQFISIAGSGWGTLAMLLALSEGERAENK